jgi:hypothetical protein
VSSAILGAEDLAVVENDGAHKDRLQGTGRRKEGGGFPREWRHIGVAITGRSGGPRSTRASLHSALAQGRLFDCARLTCEPGFAQDDTRLV